MKKKIPFIIAAISATLFIFSNSCKNAEMSGNASGFWVEKILYLLSNFKIYPDAFSVTLFVRKTAHILEFALQGFLVTGCFAAPYKKRIFYVLLLGIATACVDESLQLFFSGRAAMLKDVYIDFSGTVLGFIVFLLGHKFIQKHNS